MKKIIVFTIALSLLNACSSSGTSTGNPGVTVTVSGSSQPATVATLNNWKKILDIFIPSAVAAPPSLQDSGSLPILLSEFWTTIGEIEFKATEAADGNEVQGSEVVLTGPYTVNLLETNTPPLGTATINYNQVRRIKTKLMQAESLPSGAPSAITGKSIYIAGTVNGVNFTFSTTEETELTVGGPNAVNVSSGDNFLLQLQIANLFKLIDMSMIVSSTDISDTNVVPASNPCPSIDPSANDLYRCFRKGMETEANFGRDNGDGELDMSDEMVK